MQRVKVKRTCRYIDAEITIIRVPHLVILHTRIIEYRFHVADPLPSRSPRGANAQLGNLPEIYLLADQLV